MIFLWRKIRNSILCHSELGSESHKRIEEKSNVLSFRTCFGIAMLFQRDHATLNQVQGDKEFNTSSYRTNEVRCGIFKKVLKKIPQCVSLMRDDVKFFKKAFAFTLAETLIVMGIIGVVAALTIPNLSSSTSNKEKVTKVKKIRQNITDALGRAEAVYGPITEWGYCNDMKGRLKDRLTEFMKVSKSCEVNDASCMGSTYAYDPTVILADGSALAFNLGDDYYAIHVDIDGPTKGKNKTGEDVFHFFIGLGDGNGCSCDNENRGILYPDFCNFSWSGSGKYTSGSETAWVLQNENLDYLKCAGQLNWDTKTSCK